MSKRYCITIQNIKKYIKVYKSELSYADINGKKQGKEAYGFSSPALA